MRTRRPGAATLVMMDWAPVVLGTIPRAMRIATIGDVATRMRLRIMAPDEGGIRDHGPAGTGLALREPGGAYRDSAARSYRAGEVMASAPSRTAPPFSAAPARSSA